MRAPGLTNGIVLQMPVGSSFKPPSPSKHSKSNYDGVFSLVAVNLVVFFLDKIVGTDFVPDYLYLHHWDPSIWQFFTYCVCHGDYTHLSGNLFFIYMFGKLIEDEAGGLALVATYFICGFWSGVASFLILPRYILVFEPTGIPTDAHVICVAKWFPLAPAVQFSDCL